MRHRAIVPSTHDASPSIRHQAPVNICFPWRRWHAILLVPPDLRTKADHVRAGLASLPPTPSKDPSPWPLTKFRGDISLVGTRGHPSVSVGSGVAQPGRLRGGGDDGDVGGGFAH
jgi:hypothetical protein